jgi:hypothetical protein
MRNHALPAEVVSLVHHVELNKAGWWDRGVQHLVRGVLWLSGGPLTPEGIVNELGERFYVKGDPSRVRKQVEELRKAGTLIALPDGRLKLSERSLREMDTEIQAASDAERKAKARFAEVLADCCPTLVVDEEWKSFNERLLLPLVREIGAHAYELISGTSVALESTVRFPEFLGSYPPEHRQPVRNAILTFLDPKDINTRSYVLRHLNAYFFVEAGNLEARIVDDLARLVERPPSFKIFVDTNFLFSFLALHENPSNEAARSLMELTQQLIGKVSCKFYVSPLTLDETKRVVGAHRDFLQGLRVTPNLGSAALEAGLSGVVRKFVEFSINAGQPVNADDYFAPYLTGLIATLRANNVEFFNEPMEAYGTKQEVVDDILGCLEHEKGRYKDKAKTYQQIEHDVILWHFVAEKRPVRVESPVEAVYWVATVDYHFLGFDLFKRRNSEAQVPVCLHPTGLIQMLQFWLPRTPQFEEAVLGSLRWPFLFQDFDPAAEKATIEILKTLSRFENVSDLPREVVTSLLLNQALRQKLAVEGDIKKQIELVKEALIEENEKVRSALENTTEEAKRLKLENAEKDGQIAMLGHALEEQKAKIMGTESDLAHERAARRDIEGRLDGLERRTAQQAASAEIRRFLASSLTLLALAFGITGACLMRWKPALGFWKSSSVVWSLLALIWMWTTDRWAQTKPAVREWRPYARFHKVKDWFFGIVALVLAWTAIEFVGRAVYQWVRAARGA